MDTNSLLLQCKRSRWEIFQAGHTAPWPMWYWIALCSVKQWISLPAAQNRLPHVLGKDTSHAWDRIPVLLHLWKKIITRQNPQTNKQTAKWIKQNQKQNKEKLYRKLNSTPKVFPKPALTKHISRYIHPSVRVERELWKNAAELRGPDEKENFWTQRKAL